VGDEQRALTDREAWVGGQAREPCFLAKLGAVIGAQLVQGRPSLSVCGHVLARALKSRRSHCASRVAPGASPVVAPRWL